MKNHKTQTGKNGIAIICVALIASMVVVATFADTVIGESITMTDNTTGITKTSQDGGKTWTDTAEPQASDIIWWTYDEYKAWLDQEKIELKSVVNAPGWSQERVDDAIQMYEQQLERIKNGERFSLLSDGVAYGLNATNAIAVEDTIEYGLNATNAIAVEDTIEYGLNTTNAIAAEDTIEYGLNATNAIAVEDTPVIILNVSAPPSTGYSAIISLENGDMKDLGSYATKEERFEAVKRFCDGEVKAGKMTPQKADDILGNFK
jgi:hypothetical protein